MKTYYKHMITENVPKAKIFFRIITFLHVDDLQNTIKSNWVKR